MAEPIVLYVGPSALDGKPIVALATTGSTNRKTGPMVQTWIMRADVSPMDASRHGDDTSVCGECPRRWATGGDCYVNLGQAPLSVWRHWNHGGRSGINWMYGSQLQRLRKGCAEHGLRLGAYGDPVAVPWQVWDAVMLACEPRVHTGYTHQWAGREWVGWHRTNLMASCDSVQEHVAARAGGWRTFVALPHDGVAPDKTVLCPADREGHLKSIITCERCGACNGSQGRPTRASIYLREHGPRSTAKQRKSSRLTVLA